MHTQSVNGLSQPLYSLTVYQRSRCLAFLCLKVDKRSDTILWWMVKASGMSVHAGLEINEYTTVLHTHIHTHACTQTHAHTHRHTYTHTHRHTRTHTCNNPHMLQPTHEHACTHTRTCMHTHAYTSKHPHPPQHTHTHTWSLISSCVST